MANKALLIFDMLKDFVDEEGVLFCGESSKKIIPFIEQKIKEFKKEGVPVFYIADSHNENDPEFKFFKKHCVKGTKGAEAIDRLKPEEMDILVSKTTYDGMHRSDLDRLLKEKGIRETYLVGVCTSICVMETANSLTKEGYRVLIYKDGVADFDDEAHKFALKRMKMVYGAEVI